MNKDQLLAQMAAGYEELDGLLAALDEEHMTRPGVYDGMSIKDIVAHLASWARLAIEWIGASLCGDRPVPFAPGFEADDENFDVVVDRLNVHLYEQNRERPLKEVLTDFRAAHVHMAQLVQAMAERDLADPQRFDWSWGLPAWRIIAANNYEHYQEHMQLIRGWLDAAETKEGEKT